MTPCDANFPCPPRPAGVELRSDTFTLPTPAMRHAMATAAVGDDVWGEDPTIAALEARSAALTGKAAAVWVPSGTMGNAVAVLALAAPARAAGGGVEVLVGDQAHIYQYEQGGLSALGGLAFNVVPTREGDGTLALPDLAARLRPSAPGDGHAALTAVLCLESTHNRCGGAVLPLAYMDAVKAWADGAWAGLGCGAAGLPIHLDGARLFNAAAALGCAPSAITSRVTTVTFCLSKGAGAPAGSVVCGPADAIARARRWRKMLGGGLRQAGVLAAAGLVALDEGVHRAVADAGRARRLAAGLAAIPGIVVHTLPPQSNIVIFGLGGGEGAATDGGGGMTHDGLVEALAAAHSVRVAPFRGRIRAVTSAEVGDEDVDAAVAAVRAVVAPSTAASGR